MSKNLRVLIVENSEDDAHLLLRKIRSAGYEPVYERVDTFETMSEALDGSCWDIIIADYSLLGFSGLAALELYKDKGVDVPFIVISGVIDRDTAVDMLVAGAHDYIMKDDLTRHIPAISRELRHAENRWNRKRAEEALGKREPKAILLAEANSIFNYLGDIL